jgi:hypothetical protein
VYSGWDWRARFGSGFFWKTGDSGKAGGTENQFFMWDYLLRAKLGNDMPITQQLCQRLRGTTRSKTSGAGISVLTHAYSSSLTPLVFTTDQTFNEIQDGLTSAGAPGQAAVATPPFGGSGTDVTLLIPDAAVAMAGAVAPPPQTSATTGPPPNPTGFVDYKVGVTMATEREIIFPGKEPVEIDLSAEPGWQGPVDASWVQPTSSDGLDDDRPEPHPDW